jgi:sec-independent protein translocase protein TatC
MRTILSWITWPFRALAQWVRRFWHWLTTPLRMAARWFQANFDPPDPEEASVTDAFTHTLQHPGDILPHLEELRTRLLWAVGWLVVTTGLAFIFAQPLLEFLAQPIGGLEELSAIEITEPVGVYMRVSLLAGVTLAMPMILFQIYQFMAPGLRRAERRAILLVVPFATVLFVAGMAFTYLVMLPAAIPFLLNFGGIRTIPRPDNYFKFVTNLMFWIGVAFQMPLIIYGLAAAGLVKASSLAQNWRIAVIAIAILAAMITPTVDPVTMGLTMLPMIVLYLLSVLMASIAQRGREGRARGAASAA